MSAEGPVFFYDGVCALCNGGVKFVLKRDERGTVRFAPLQGETARTFLATHPALDAIDSMIWVAADGTISIRSDAVIAIGKHIGGVWGALAGLARVVPRPVRDAIYDFTARIRYRTFGKYDACPIPPQEQRGRFLA